MLQETSQQTLNPRMKYANTCPVNAAIYCCQVIHIEIYWSVARTISWSLCSWKDAKVRTRFASQMERYDRVPSLLWYILHVLGRNEENIHIVSTCRTITKTFMDVDENNEKRSATIILLYNLLLKPEDQTWAIWNLSLGFQSASLFLR